MKRWYYLNVMLLVSLIGQTLTLGSSCPYSTCQNFGYCTSDAGDSSFCCPYWNNTCTLKWEYQGKTVWCCSMLSIEGISEGILSVGGCCQYDCEIYDCVETGRTFVVMYNGILYPTLPCNSDIGLCGFYA
jgi:hypothetical protein